MISPSKKNIEEGEVKLEVYDTNKISKKLPVFYNPQMEMNRELSVTLLNSLSKHMMTILLPLAGGGARGLRLIKELSEGKIKKIHFNDNSEKAVNQIHKNFKLNELKLKKLQKKNLVGVSNADADMFMLATMGGDYIDIDPFGTPTQFLNSAVKSLSRNSILAVTATDVSALAGTYINACKRKYWSVPKKDGIMHETGLRILIRRVQLTGANYDKALIPVFSYFKDHYMRVFFHCRKGKKKCDEILKQHQDFNGAGPLWTGKLWNTDLVEEMINNNNNEKTKNFLQKIRDESKIDQLGFYHIHHICKKNRKQVPNFTTLFSRIKEKGYNVSRTHFTNLGIRTDMPYEELLKILD